MERKITVWIFRETNWRDLTGQNADMSMNGKSLESNGISSNPYLPTPSLGQDITQGKFLSLV